MTVQISQKTICDMCGRVVRHLEQEVKNGAVPQIISRDFVMNHQGSHLDICDACLPPLMRAFSALKLAKEAGDAD
jgi:ribosome-binding protein aMBF1 (putative translation factor)